MWRYTRSQVHTKHVRVFSIYLHARWKKVESNSTTIRPLISINLAKAVFFARKGDRVEVDEKKVFAVFNFSTISPSLGDPFHRITTC